MEFQVGDIVHIEIPAPDIGKAKAFYGKVFNWTFSPMDERYEFWDSGRMQGAFDADAKPHTHGTVLVLACKDVDEKLKEVEEAGGKIVQATTAIGGDHGWYAYFEDPNGNRLGVWMPANA